MTQPAHPTTEFALDVIDKLIKLAAVLIGGCWTWWNYRKSRTYQQKLELDIQTRLFTKTDLYGDLRLLVTNIGEARHIVEHTGTFCELFIVRDDLSEQSAALFRVFTSNRSIEPGETMDDTLCWCITRPLDRILWIKLKLRVVADGVEWISTRLVHIESDSTNRPSEVN